MSYKQNTIEDFQKAITNASALENIVYENAIELLENEVNPDKVKHWVNQTLNTFNNKPKPMSDKEKQKREDKKRRKAEKQAKLKSLNEAMATLLASYGVYIIGFFDSRELCESEYDLLKMLATKNNYQWQDVGDGALEPFVSRKELDGAFFKEYNTLHSELIEAHPTNDWEETVLKDYMTWDAPTFRKKIQELI